MRTPPSILQLKFPTNTQNVVNIQCVDVIILMCALKNFDPSHLILLLTVIEYLLILFIAFFTLGQMFTIKFHQFIIEILFLQECPIA